MARREISRDSIKNRVLDAAEKSVGAIGLARSSMSDMVKSSGVSRRTFYKVFGSKDDLLKALIDRRVDRVAGFLGGLAGNDMTTADKVHAVLRTIQAVTSFVTPEMMRELHAAHPEVWEYLDGRRTVVIRLWKDILLEGQRRGEIRRDVDPDFFVQVITVIAQNMLNPTWIGDHDVPLGRAIGQIVEILLYGVLERGDGRGPRTTRGAREVKP